jgi:hypothetical protein
MSRALGVVRARGKGLRGFWAHVGVQQLSIRREMWLGNGNCSSEPHHHNHVVAAMAMDLRALVSGKVPPIRFAMPRATFSTFCTGLGTGFGRLHYPPATPPPPCEGTAPPSSARECRSARLAGDNTRQLLIAWWAAQILLCVPLRPSCAWSIRSEIEGCGWISP